MTIAVCTRGTSDRITSKMFVSRQKASFGLIVLASCGVFFFVLSFTLRSFEHSSRSSRIGGNDFFTVWPAYDPVPPYKQDWYNRHCFGGARPDTVEYIGRSLKLWSVSKNSHCRDVLNNFHDVYKVETRHGQVRLPAEFVAKVSNWLGGDKNAEALVSDQTMIHISNVYTHQQTIVTPLRARRPMRKALQDPLDYVMSFANATRATCDFCNFRKFSAEDVFGRLESEYAFTASNTFKMDKWHGLIVPKLHNFVNLSMVEVVDVMRLAKRWTEMVHHVDKAAMYAMLSWDNTEHAGASQFHPHIHAFVDSSHYYEMLEMYRWGAQRYANEHGQSNYFTDITVMHHALGLAESFGNATVIVELTERGDCEFVIMSPDANDNLYTLFFHVIRTIMDELEMYSYSMVMVMPIMSDKEQMANMPAMIRITTRGEVNSLYTDISGFDLYLTHNTVRDPYILISKLRSTMRNYEDL